MARIWSCCRVCCSLPSHTYHHQLRVRHTHSVQATPPPGQTTLALPGPLREIIKMGGSRFGRMERAQNQDHIPRSQGIIRDRNTEGISTTPRMTRGQAKILGVQNWDEKRLNRSSVCLPMDDLMGLDVSEALEEFESENQDDKPAVSLQKMSLSIMDVKSIPKPMRHLMAGGFAGAVSKTATAPVEFVRMKMMVGGAKAGGFLEVVAAAWKQNGALGFFNGNLADVIRVTPTKAVQLAAFDVFKRKLSKKDENGKRLPPSAFATTAAGALAGVTSTIATFPLEVLRTRLACSVQYANMVDATFQIIKTEGVMAFYAGVQPSIIGVIPYAGVNLGMYDGLRALYMKVSKNDTGKVPKGVALVCGAVSGCVGATCCFPLEVVRRRMMMGAPYKNTLDALITIARSEGVGALFNGCFLGWVKLAPSSGLSFYCYESAKEVLKL